MRWRWTRARARGEKKRPHVIQDHVRSFGACVIIAARRALWCLYFLGHLMARRIMKKSAYAAGLWPMETLDELRSQLCSAVTDSQ
jgi:hypothetical protein